MGSYKDEITRLETDKYWTICLGGQLGRKETSEKEDKQTSRGRERSTKAFAAFPQLTLCSFTASSTEPRGDNENYDIVVPMCVCVFA